VVPGGTIPTNPDEGLQRMVSDAINQVYSTMPGAQGLFGNAATFTNQLQGLLGSDINARNQFVNQYQQPSDFVNSLRQQLSNVAAQRYSPQGAVYGTMSDQGPSGVAQNLLNTQMGNRDTLLQQLYGYGQGVQGQAQAGIGQSQQQRQDLINRIIGQGQSIQDLIPQLMAQRNAQVTSASNPAIAGLTRAAGLFDEGLSPQVQNAMFGQSKEMAQQGFQQAAQQMKEQLAARGAIGQQDLPDALGDVVNALGPLYSGREQAVTQGFQNAVLANQQALNANRGLATQAAGTLGGLSGTLGNIYNPADITNALNQIMGTTNAGIGTAGQVYNPTQWADVLNQARGATTQSLTGAGQTYGDINSLLNSYLNANAQRYQNAGQVANIFDPNALLSGSNQALSTQYNLLNDLGNLYSGTNAMNAANQGFGAQNQTLGQLGNLLGIPFQGTGQLAQYGNTNFGTTLLASLLGGGTSGAGGGVLGKIVSSIPWDKIWGKVPGLGTSTTSSGTGTTGTPTIPQKPFDAGGIGIDTSGFGTGATPTFTGF